MAPEREILACYSWETGACFRCARTRLATALVGRVTPRSGEVHDVRACEKCVLHLEAEKKAAVERRGETWEPGRLDEA